MCTCLRISFRIYMCMCVHLRICIQTSHVSVYMLTYTHTESTYVTYTHTESTCVRVYVCVYTHKCTSVYVVTYIFAYTLTSVHVCVCSYVSAH